MDLLPVGASVLVFTGIEGTISGYGIDEGPNGKFRTVYLVDIGLSGDNPSLMVVHPSKIQ